MEKSILEVAMAITEADAIFISAGAGMGVDSGFSLIATLLALLTLLTLNADAPQPDDELIK